MSPDEIAEYDSHVHDYATLGNHAGPCCMAKLLEIERRHRQPTLFDEVQL